MSTTILSSTKKNMRPASRQIVSASSATKPVWIRSTTFRNAPPVAARTSPAWAASAWSPCSAASAWQTATRARPLSVITAAIGGRIYTYSNTGLRIITNIFIHPFLRPRRNSPGPFWLFFSILCRNSTHIFSSTRFSKGKCLLIRIWINMDIKQTGKCIFFTEILHIIYFLIWSIKIKYWILKSKNIEYKIRVFSIYHSLYFLSGLEKMRQISL